MAAYATLEMLKSSMQKNNDDDDVILMRILDGAERKINRFCNRPDGFLAPEDAVARYYAGSSFAYQLIDECVEVTAVAVKDSQSDVDYEAWATPTTNFAGDGDWIACTGDQYQPDFVTTPYTMLIIDPNGDQSWFTGETPSQKKRGRRERGSSLLSRMPTVQVTARWGFAEHVPPDIREACIEQSARWYKKDQGATAPQLSISALGVLSFPTLDPDIMDILRNGRYARLATGRR